MSCKEDIDYEMLISDMEAGIYELKVLLADNDGLLKEIEKRDAVIEAAEKYMSPLDHIENRDAELRLMNALKALKEKE